MGKVDEALSILKAFGLPKAQQNERSALTLLALANLQKRTPWPKAKSRFIRIHSDSRSLGIHSATLRETVCRKYTRDD